MRIIQSFWSKPYFAEKRKGGCIGGWSHPLFFYMSWALSCLSLRKFYTDVELYTDEAGKRLLIDTLRLPYTKVHVLLDELNDYDIDLWAIGKMFTYKLQTKPFLHVDGDVYIWKAFPTEVEDASLVAQNLEKNYPYNIKFIKEAKSTLAYIPSQVIDCNTSNEINAGILGGTDMSFFETYTQIGFDFIHQNQKNYKKLKNPGMFNTLYEQYLFYCLCESLNHKVSYLLNDIDASFKHLCNFEDIPNSYIQHALSFYKKEFNIGESVSSSLFYLSEYHHNLIVEDIKNNVI